MRDRSSPRPSAIIRALLLALVPVAVASAQTPQAPLSSASPVRAPGSDRLSTAELEELVGPIALYPDTLLANILAASVYPDEVAAVAKAVASGTKPEQIASGEWEPPVKAVAKVPDALKMLADYPEWTVALGQTYLRQPDELMKVVQSLRATANSNGALKTTEQQEVIVREQTIIIEPADPEIIYVPSYSPSVVYVDDPGDEWIAGAIGFGAGILVGAALNDLDCDWHGGCVGWGYHGHNDIDIDINGDVNIGNTVSNRQNVGNRVGNEGKAWAPNNSKTLASSKTDMTQNFRSGSTGARRPTSSNPNRPAATRGTPATRPGSPATRPGSPAARPSPAATGAPASRVPASRPPSQVSRPNTGASPGAFSGGRQSAAESARGSRSRESASRNSGSRSGARSSGSRPSRSGGGGGRSGGRR
jgi:uncharacterized membrane protein YgcG